MPALLQSSLHCSTLWLDFLVHAGPALSRAFGFTSLLLCSLKAALALHADHYPRICDQVGRFEK